MLAADTVEAAEVTSYLGNIFIIIFYLNVFKILSLNFCQAMSAVVTGLPEMVVGVAIVEGVDIVEEDTAMEEDSGEPEKRRFSVWTS